MISGQGSQWLIMVIMVACMIMTQTIIETRETREYVGIYIQNVSVHASYNSGAGHVHKTSRICNQLRWQLLQPPWSLMIESQKDAKESHVNKNK